MTPYRLTDRVNCARLLSLGFKLVISPAGVPAWVAGLPPATAPYYRHRRVLGPGLALGRPVACGPGSYNRNVRCVLLGWTSTPAEKGAAP